MANLYKRFAGLVTKWKTNNEFDEFFVARIRLTLYYSITAIVILGIASLILYNTILSNFSRSVFLSVGDTDIAQTIISKAQDMLLNRFISIDILLVLFIIILGFMLTNKTLEPIRENVEKQKRFIADASHELKTPVAVAISGLEVNLANNNLDLESARKTLENTLEEMRELSKLSNQLLELSKKKFVYKETEPIKINELISLIVNKSKNLALSKNINFVESIKNNAIIEGNKMEIERVFYNILDNAIKYNIPGGKIYVSDRIFFNKYIVTISDNGPGIAREIIDRVFDSFFRGDTSRNTPGAGLGLTISKKIIEEHKGSISIRSNKGTTVVISLPVSS